MLNLIRAVMGIHNRRFNLFVKCSSDATFSPGFTEGCGRDGGLQRESYAARKGARRVGNDGGEYSLGTPNMPK